MQRRFPGQPAAVSATSGRKPRRLFTSDGDARLVELVGQLGAHAWPLVADRLPGRSPRQCKERYCTYLCPTVRTSPWSDAEDQLLFQKVREHGPRWSDIARFLEGRTANAIKNRWHLHIRGCSVRPPPTPLAAAQFACQPPAPLWSPHPPLTAQPPGDAPVIKDPQHPRKEQFPSVFSLPFPQNHQNG
jgi:hypothetical protein